MTAEAWKTLAIIAPTIAVVISRVLSHFEHKKTGEDVKEIKIYINGEMDKKLEAAREEGRLEERKINTKP